MLERGGSRRGMNVATSVTAAEATALGFENTIYVVADRLQHYEDAHLPHPRSLG